MTFFSGFGLEGETALFNEIIGSDADNPYLVAGFSYGAIKALEYVERCDRRVDRLVLLSPAFFKGESRAFVKAQILYFKKDPEAYFETFLTNAAYPADKKLLEPFAVRGSVEELEELLTYEWPEERLDRLLGRGVAIETFLGARDRIVDAGAAHAFFRNFGESWLFKPYGHILHEGERDG
ncbi:pimelyl-ACP methyl ester esterase BioV [Hydrogenimonas sp.]